MLEFDNKKLNIIVGSLLIIISIMMIFTYTNLKNSKTSVNTNTYKVYVSSVVGIKKNQPVNIGGYNIGFVKDISINNYYPLLTLNINKNVEITADAIIQLSNVSLFSSVKSINIINGVDSELLKDNSYISDSNLGIDLDQLLNMVEIYLKQKIKP